MLIQGKENVSFFVDVENNASLDVTLGSIRLIRDFSLQEVLQLKSVLKTIDDENVFFDIITKWLHPQWALSNMNTTALLRIQAINNVDFYELLVNSSKPLSISGEPDGWNHPGTLKIQNGSNLSIVYASSFKPLTPFKLQELLKPEALETVNYLKGKQNLPLDDALNGLRFLAFKEKLLAGSWHYLTYFGRDSLISLRMLVPVVKLQLIEACVESTMRNLRENGEIAHEENLGDRAFIDQLVEMSQTRKYCKPQELKNATMVYNMVDESYLALPLLLDYFYMNGTKLFDGKSQYFGQIVKNINYCLQEAVNSELVKIKESGTVGDWRDSTTGLGWGKYSSAVNTGHIPAALKAFQTLLNKSAFRENDLLAEATSKNYFTLKRVLDDKNVLESAVLQWSQVWKNFVVENGKNESIAALNRHRSFLQMNLTKQNSLQSYIALSLAENQEQIPIMSSDPIFMVLDLQLDDEALNVALAPFNVEFPDGLYSKVGNIVASAAFASEDLVEPTPKHHHKFNNYLEMFDNSQYHGEVIWSWHQVLLDVALLKLTRKWITPATSQSLNHSTNAIIQEIQSKLKNLFESEGQTEELWSWTLDKQMKRKEFEGVLASNVEQLWSVVMLGPMLWKVMQQSWVEKHIFETISITFCALLCAAGIVTLIVYIIKQKKPKQFANDEVETLNEHTQLTEDHTKD